MILKLKLNAPRLILLFTYINDVINITDDSYVDSVVFVSENAHKLAEFELAKIKNWVDVNILSLKRRNQILNICYITLFNTQY